MDDTSESVKKVKRVEIGDVVTTLDGAVYTVYGYMVGDRLPTEEQVRALLAPLYPSENPDDYLMVCTFGDIVGYEPPNDGKYGRDSIFWGT